MDVLKLISGIVPVLYIQTSKRSTKKFLPKTDLFFMNKRNDVRDISKLCSEIVRIDSLHTIFSISSVRNIKI